MTKSTITRERVQWLHDAATEFASTKLKMTMRPDEVLALTSALLSAMDSEPAPVVQDGIERVASMVEYLGNFAAAAIIRQLAANQPQNAPQNIPEIIPDCWCRTCRPVDLNDMRFVVCPDCGNKRCPRANDHRNSCTGSNEPGQEGSAYTDTPREVK
ncbi:hypothetical protein [Klebsiella quasipneumoniae]|uniref:hypothetical protein n=1 Tax=Klebsiella quasipneumoniae TaxID=1463165 RepID=UPI002DBED83D|nr:hypothetical protein [Klebsiella quasipneumoniae]MEB5816656.1 hypothetical protein [Klebsiella quasipneumoniae]